VAQHGIYPMNMAMSCGASMIVAAGTDLRRCGFKLCRVRYTTPGEHEAWGISASHLSVNAWRVRIAWELSYFSWSSTGLGWELSLRTRR